MAVQPEAPQAAGGSPGLASTVSSRSGQRAYLQSLERSSRAWLLASGKPQGSGVAVRPSEEAGTSIWYNPIPEEDDAGAPPAEIWRRREEVMTSPTTKRAGEGDAGAEPADGSRPPAGGADAGPRPEACREDAGEKSWCLCWASGPVSGSLLLLCPDRSTSDTSPTSQKKVVDRLRSPGTVRKLSLKMKKLPELRRKLSLRSSSRSHRQDADAAPSGSAPSPPVSSNQNVLSRYHLDSSAPPARARRRPSRGRSGGKGGEASGSWCLRVDLQPSLCHPSRSP